MKYASCKNWDMHETKSWNNANMLEKETNEQIFKVWNTRNCVLQFIFWNWKKLYVQIWFNTIYLWINHYVGYDCEIIWILFTTAVSFNFSIIVMVWNFSIEISLQVCIALVRQFSHVNWFPSSYLNLNQDWMWFPSSYLNLNQDWMK